MPKKLLIKINRKLQKTFGISSTTLNSITPEYSVVYIEGNFEKRDSDVLKAKIESFSNEKFEVNFMFPEFLYKDDECIPNSNMITVAIIKL